MGFPQFGNIDSTYLDTINSRVDKKTGGNVKVSYYMPWIRVTSCLSGFLTLESSRESTSFAQQYGYGDKSGRVGFSTDKANKTQSVFAPGDRKFRPSPTIDSVSVSNGNEGLSKKTSFEITCYSLGQTELIMEHFCEPGNMVFVEWGHNNAKSIGAKPNINVCEIAAFHSNIHLQKKRKLSGGTYDAILGTITGGGMSYGDNETFSISVELTSLGDLPAYLQHHKGLQDDSTKEDKSSQQFSPAEIDTEAEDNVGLTLFMQMYNDLPGNKRNSTVKALSKQEWATNASNFVNFDSEIREKFSESLKGKELHQEGEDGEDIEITSDTPLFTDKRFIRVALAFEILDLQNTLNLDPKQSLNGCKNAKFPKAKVIWKNTICRAHKNMYSADSNFLYVPNQFAPSFDIIKALSSTAKMESPIPSFPKGSRELPLDKTADLHPKEYGGTKGSYFPNNNALDFTGLAEHDGTYVPLTEDAGKWGYLRDLYINFDFFVDVVKNSSGLVTKDVYYKLLNGMSGAVNMFWDFQIVQSSNIKTHGGQTADSWYDFEKGRDTSDDCDSLQIVDASFLGKTISKGVGMARFQSRGVKSPFLSAELNFDIPGAMKGMIVMQKTKGAPNNANPDVKEQDIRGLFTAKTDVVLQELNSMVTKNPPPDDEQLSAGDQKKFDEDEEAAQKAANFEYFVGNAAIIPKIQDREELESMDFIDDGAFDGDYGNGQFADILVVGTWDDQGLLKKVQLFNDGAFIKDGASSITQETSNPPLLPIAFSFTVHGVSGIRVGDTFSIKDLPGKYNKKVFQVTEISHDIQQNLWTTKVMGKMRNINWG